METTANDLPLPLRDPKLVLLQSQGRKQEAVTIWSMNWRQLSRTPSLTDSRPRLKVASSVQFAGSAIRL